MYNLPIHVSVNDSDFAIREDFIITKFRGNKTLAKNSEFTLVPK